MQVSPTLPLPAPKNTVDLSWIQKAALYPFNKEMHAFVRTRDLLAFELVGMADPVGKGLVGKDAGEALGLSSIGVRLQGDLHELAEKKGLHLVYPSISPEEVECALQSDETYSPVDVPVLGLFGTSAQQGKFTLQLALRRRLLQMGYQVGQIGIEHQAELFGMAFDFLIGRSTAPALRAVFGLQNALALSSEAT